MLILACSSIAARADTLTVVPGFGSNPGELAMYEHVPADLPSGSPLVVVLHGCSQMAVDMLSAGWNQLADRYHFAVVYPEQQPENNPARCFNWGSDLGDLSNLERGMGENQSILSMIDTAIAAHGLDRNHVYITGVSAGGAFTSVMLATWPERFAAGVVMSGVPYRCAITITGALLCLNPGISRSADEWGDLVRDAAPLVGTRPRVQIWHGDDDATILSTNLDEQVKQWTNVLGASVEPTTTETIGAATHTTHEAGGDVVVEAYRIAGMGHAIAIGGGDCPATTAPFFEDHGICSTTIAADFFGLFGAETDGDAGPEPDGQAPTDPEPEGEQPTDPQDETSGCVVATAPTAPFSWVVVLSALALRRHRRHRRRGPSGPRSSA